MSQKRNSYRVTLLSLTAGDGQQPQRVEFIHHNHDDIAPIVRLAQASSGFDPESAAAMAVGLKLLSEVMLDHKDNHLFDGLRGPLGDFIRLLKARAAAAS